ncbi:MAG: hypothetical protein WAT79_11870 [Saprospiraceae bacterium]
MNGASVDDLGGLCKYAINSMMERNFKPNNITFSELSNSGNLNLISNDSIKFLLLELEELYKINDFGIEHETYDYREYISKSINRYIDIEQLFPVFLGQKTAEEQKVKLDHFHDLLKCKEYKNGLFIMTFISEYNLHAYQSMKSKSEKIIRMIEKE